MAVKNKRDFCKCGSKAPYLYKSENLCIHCLNIIHAKEKAQLEKLNSEYHTLEKNFREMSKR